MRAVRRTEHGVDVVEVEQPDGAGARVRVHAAGICGSDLEMLAFGPSPITIGHEFAGVAEDGTAVAVLPYVSCGTCESCLAGATERCADALGATYGIARDGGMADGVLVDPSCLAPLPDGVTLDNASLVEPTAVALHALHRGGATSGMRAGVIGAGTIGLLCGAVARDAGCDVGTAARHATQRNAAEALGCRTELTGDYDVVFEAAGSASAFGDAVNACKPGGTVVLVSTGWHEVTVSFMAAQMKEVSIVPAFAYGHADGAREFDTAATLLARHPEIADVLVTHRFPLADAAQAFAVAADRASGAIKVVLHP